MDRLGSCQYDCHHEPILHAEFHSKMPASLRESGRSLTRMKSDLEFVFHWIPDAIVVHPKTGFTPSPDT